jgi:hypothetical protein
MGYDLAPFGLKNRLLNAGFGRPGCAYRSCLVPTADAMGYDLAPSGLKNRLLSIPPTGRLTHIMCFLPMIWHPPG